MPRVTIDNHEVEVVPGSNLLAAARKLGIDVPALCYHPACTPNTSCMACLMKVKNPDRIVPSCATPAEDGMVVESETAEIHALRRTALELLLSDHVGECQSCDSGKRDICRLRKYADLYGADAERFRGPPRRLERGTGFQPVSSHRQDAGAAHTTGGRRYEHPEITYDPGKCILCGICIQLARQAGEPLGLTLVGRGFDVRVDVPFDESLAKGLQKAARRCAGACPTGALRKK